MVIEFDFRLISKDNEKIRGRRHGKPYLSREYKIFEARIRAVAKKQWISSTLECSIKVTIAAYFKTKVHADCFNLPKGICDALQGIAYKNDRQIKIGRIVVVSEKWQRDLFRIYIEEVHDAEFIKENIFG